MSVSTTIVVAAALMTAEAPAMTNLIDEAHAYVIENSDYQRRDTPEIEFIDRRFIELWAPNPLGTVLSFYDVERDTIYVNEEFDPANIRDRALFIHELYHSYQHANNALDTKHCTGMLEYDAYSIEATYLLENDATFTEADYNQMHRDGAIQAAFCERPDSTIW